MKIFYILIHFVFIVLIASAQSDNDECSDAIELIVNSTCNPTFGNTGSATESLPPTECISSNTQDVWYKFVANSGSLKIELKCSFGFYGVEELMENCSGPSLACESGGLGADNILNASGLTIGNTYYIRVYDYYTNSSPSTDFSICVWNPEMDVKEIGTSDDVLHVFPNPFSTETIITTNSQLNNATLTIENCYGHTIKKINDVNELSKVALTRDNIETGMYFVRLWQNNQIISTAKLVVVD